RDAVHVGLGRCQNDSRERAARAAPGSCYHWVRKLFGSAEIFRRIALGLLSSPANCISYRRCLDQRMAQSSRRQKIRRAWIGHDAKRPPAAMDCVVKQDPRSSETEQ